MSVPVNMRALPPLLAAIMVGAGCAGASDDGRKGNARFADENFREAATAFQEGLDRFSDDTPGKVRSDLLNNLGAANHRNENVGAARNAFVESVAMAESVDDQVRGSYNAGISAFAEGDKRLSADYFRQALLLDPNNTDAKFNYEFVRRQLQEDQQDQQSGGSEPPPKPSEYAMQLKAQAEELVAARRYRQAHEIMINGLRVDPSVKAYQTFIDRTASVADIDQDSTGDPGRGPVL